MSAYKVDTDNPCMCGSLWFRPTVVHGHDGRIHSLATRSDETGGWRSLGLEYCVKCGTVRVRRGDRGEA